MGSIDSLIRKNIRSLKPYSSARDEYEGEAAVFLDANENPWFAPLNRYPDPRQRNLKRIISELKSVPAENIFLGNGSDEAIDILVRAFCEPGTDNIVSIDPSYGMYEVTAAINGVEFRKAPLAEDFSLDAVAIRELVDGNTKMIILCSPNNPTGNSFSQGDINELTGWFAGILVIDEAYIDFSPHSGFLPWITEGSTLVVLQTMSKGWGRAGIRLGMAFGSTEVVGVMNKIKPPYNINMMTTREAIKTLGRAGEVRLRVKELVASRDWLREQLGLIPSVQKIYPSDANFLLVRVDDADSMYEFLKEQNIIVRNRSTARGCANCLRITVGTPAENESLLKVMRNYKIKG
jgi:histidinol-phosphate aminotransferase